MMSGEREEEPATTPEGRDAEPPSRRAAECWALVLAAGRGERFGGDKLLAPFHERPLADHAFTVVRRAVTVGSLAGGVAVVPAALEPLRRLAGAAALDLADNTGPEDGISSSLRLGLARVMERSGGAADGVLVVLADQPLLRFEVIEQLVAAWRGTGQSVRPRYQDQPGVPGHPVLLDRSAWEQAASLAGDRGLGPLFEAQPGIVTVIDVAGRNPDVDTAADLARLEEST
jgi:molybdenum cofactor cytidylyltransferase